MRRTFKRRGYAGGRRKPRRFNKDRRINNYRVARGGIRV